MVYSGEDVPLDRRDAERRARVLYWVRDALKDSRLRGAEFVPRALMRRLVGARLDAYCVAIWCKRYGMDGGARSARASFERDRLTQSDGWTDAERASFERSGARGVVCDLFSLDGIPFRGRELARFLGRFWRVGDCSCAVAVVRALRVQMGANESEV